MTGHMHEKDVSFSGKYEMKACHILKWPSKVLPVLSLFHTIPRAFIASSISWYRESTEITLFLSVYSEGERQHNSQHPQTNKSECIPSSV